MLVIILQLCFGFGYDVCAFIWLFKVAIVDIYVNVLMNLDGKVVLHSGFKYIMLPADTSCA